MLDEPALQCEMIDPVIVLALSSMITVSLPAIALTDQVIEKTLNMRPFYRMVAFCMDETVLREVQCAHHIASTMVVGLNGMGQSTW